MYVCTHTRAHKDILTYKNMEWTPKSGCKTKIGREWKIVKQNVPMRREDSYKAIVNNTA